MSIFTETLRESNFCVSSGEYQLAVNNHGTIFEISVEEKYFILLSHDHLHISNIDREEALSIHFFSEEFKSSIWTEELSTRRKVSEALRKIHSIESWNQDGYLDTSDIKVKKCIAVACIRRAVPIIRLIFSSCPINISLMEKTEEPDLISKLQNNIDKFDLSTEYRLPFPIIN